MKVIRLFLVLICGIIIGYFTHALCVDRIYYIDSKYSESVREYFENDIIDLDSLKKLYGENKSFISSYEKQSLIALSYYPELQMVHIEFIFGNINTTMSCRPTFKSMLYGERHYQIFINNNPEFEGILLQDVPFNAQIGVIGHEFAHVFDYETRSFTGVLQRGLNYLTRNGKKTYERSIDKLTIQKGLGWQLYDWADFSMYKSEKATDKYKDFKRDIYMSPEEIKAEIFNSIY
jgi:hypothetical protein